MTYSDQSSVLAALARASEASAPAATQPAAWSARSTGWWVRERYNLAMLDTLERLAQMRGTITPTHAFIAACFVAHVHHAEATRIAYYRGWLISAGADELSAHRFLKDQGAKAFGAKVPWRFKRETIVEKLAVTVDEMRLLPAFQPADLKARMKREAARKERDRRAAGAIERSDYLSDAASRRAQILGLAAHDLSNAAIAAAIGMTEGHARVFLHRARKQAKADLKVKQQATALRLHAEGCELWFIAGELGIPESRAAAVLKAALKAAAKPSKKRR